MRVTTGRTLMSGLNQTQISELHRLLNICKNNATKQLTGEFAGHREKIKEDRQDLDKEQAKINREDAKATGALSWIQRLWRPTLAWVCVLAFMFQFLVIPITNWVCALRGTTIDLPTLDSSTLMTVLFSLLGLTGARSFDKLKKISGKK